MAGDLNRIMLIGRLTRDPELRQIQSGTSLCRFSIANNRIYSQNGERKEEVSFFNCTAWGRLAEIVHQYCRKGKQVGVEGRLRHYSWQDNDGKKNSSVEVVAEQLQLLGSSQGGGSQDMPSDAIPVGQQEESKKPVSVTRESPSESSKEGSWEDDDIPF